jgi:hypothetical protein
MNDQFFREGVPLSDHNKSFQMRERRGAACYAPRSAPSKSTTAYIDEFSSFVASIELSLLHPRPSLVQQEACVSL